MLRKPSAAFLEPTYICRWKAWLTGEALPTRCRQVPLGRDIARAETSLITYLLEQTGAETNLKWELSRTTVRTGERKGPDVITT